VSDLVLTFANSVFLLLLVSPLFLRFLTLFLLEVSLPNYLGGLHLHTVRYCFVLMSHCLLRILESPLDFHLI